MASGIAGDLLVALALIFVIEGLAYALFPDGMRRLHALAATVPGATLRNFGLLAAATGFALVWLMRW